MVEPTTLYERCSTAHDGETNLILQCVASYVESSEVRREMQTNVPVNAASAEDVLQWMLIMAGALGT